MPSASVKTAYVCERRIANKAQTAEFFATDLTTVNSWVAKGCPVVQRGSRGVHWKLDLLEVAQWRFVPKEREGTTDPELMSAKERLDWYRGNRERDNHRRDRGELIHVDDVIKRWTDMIQTAKASLLALPTRISPKLLKAKSLRDIENQLKDALTNILDELADGSPR